MFSLCLVLFNIIFVGPVRHCDHLVPEGSGGCFAFHFFVTYVLHVIVCLLFLSLLFVDYDHVIVTLSWASTLLYFSILSG